MTDNGITPELLAVFMRVKELQPIYYRCIQHDICRSTDPGQHCPECAECALLKNRVGRTPTMYVHGGGEAILKSPSRAFM